MAKEANNTVKEANNTVKEINDGVIILKDEAGKEHKFDLLFTFDSDETGKSYMAYTDNSTNKDGQIQVFASIYDPTGEDLTIYPLQDEKEWKVIQEILNGIQEQVSQIKDEESEE